jgi:hypothetical protein
MTSDRGATSSRPWTRGANRPLARDSLFYYPFPVPQRTTYRELGIGPDASDEEVQAAKSATVRRLLEEKGRLDQAIERVYDQVPGLQRACEENEQADTVASPAARRTLAELEAKALAVDPALRNKRLRSAELETKVHELNEQALEKPANRRAYDRAHPPLGLLNLRECAGDDFLEGVTCLHLLRKDVASFLSARGVAVLHPSDLTREDFTSDFSRNPILDGPDDERQAT